LIAVLPQTLGAQKLACKQKSFETKVAGGEAFKYAIEPGLEFVLDPHEDHEGWSIRVSPKNSDVDWSYPVNLPLDGEAQSLASGWGASTQDKLSGTTKLRFVLNSSDFLRYSTLADAALRSSSPSAAGDFIADLKKGAFGLIILTNFQHEMDASPNSVKWVRFRATIIVPESLGNQPDWQTCPCPAAR
jgi:hypothetical protein